METKMTYVINIMLVCVVIAIAQEPVRNPLPQADDDSRSVKATAARTKRNNHNDRWNEGINIELTKEAGFLPYGYITIGIETRNKGNRRQYPQQFKMAFDLGSTSTWVPLRGDFRSERYNTFDPPENTTCNVTDFGFEQKYTGDVIYARGVNCRDTICIQDRRYGKEALCAGPVFFGVSFDTHRKNREPFDGILGMANFKDPYVDQIADLWKLRVNRYSVLQKILDANNLPNAFSVMFNSKGGIITLGGMDPRYYRGETHWHDVDSNKAQLWKILDFTVYLGVKRYTYLNATFDTGSPKIFVPLDFYNCLGNKVDAGKHGIVDCRMMKKFPTINILFDKYEVELKPEDYVIKESGFFSNKCKLVIEDWQYDDSWLLGEAFYHKVYTTFNAETMQIGFSDLA